MLKHGAGVGGGESTRLGVEIKEDRVRLPVAKGADGGFVDAGDKEGGGTPGAEAVGFDAFGGDVGDMVDGGGSPVEFGSNVMGGYVVRVAGGVIVMIEGSFGGGGEGAEVFDMTAEGTDGAQVKVPGCAVSKGFSTGTVLLVSVGEGCVGPLLHIMQSAGNGRDALDKGTAEGSVS